MGPSQHGLHYSSLSTVGQFHISLRDPTALRNAGSPTAQKILSRAFYSHVPCNHVSVSDLPHV